MAVFGFSCVYAADNAVIVVKTKDGKQEEKTVELKDMGAFKRLEIPKESVADNVEYIDVIPSFAHAKEGDKGFYLFPDGMLGRFDKRPDASYSSWQTPIKLSGMQTPERTFAAIVKGMPFECKTFADVKKGQYRMFHRFIMKEDLKPYENIVIDYYTLTGDDADYSGMGRLYRNWQLGRGEVRPIKERIKDNPYLKYAALAPEIRIRQGWKPVPSPVKEQTLANEPKMKVVVTFDRVGDIVDELKKQGVEKAEICLVGWNKSGHDGRWPTPFPVEPTLGGEAKLRALIKKAQDAGYQIVCHTNSGDTYRISPDFSEADIARNSDGSFQKNACWGGGQMYNLDYKKSYDKFLPKYHQQTADLGFRGLHYIDVLSTVRPTVNFDPANPLNRKEAAEYANKHLADAAKRMGGAASEGGFDHVASTLDYGLYITFKLDKSKWNKAMINEYVPIWHIIYNGIILGNPGTDTINFTIKDPETAMKVVEYSGRPSFYFYSGFRDDGKNWMGKDDLHCATDKELQDGVAAIKRGCDILDKYGWLQFEFLDSHRSIADKVYESKFSDGTVIICNYSDKPFKYRGKDVEPINYRVFKPSLLRQVKDLF